MSSSKPMIDRVLYRGETNNGLYTVLTPDAVRVLNHMQEQFLGGRAWDDIYETIPYPWEGIFVFCSDDAWSQGLWQYATGTTSEMRAWLDQFRKLGGTVTVHSGGNTVPLSNDSVPQAYPLRDELVMGAFGIPRDRLCLRVTVSAAVPEEFL